jgi:hypothetical protein
MLPRFPFSGLIFLVTGLKVLSRPGSSSLLQLAHISGTFLLHNMYKMNNYQHSGGTLVDVISLQNVAL